MEALKRIKEVTQDGNIRIFDIFKTNRKNVYYIYTYNLSGLKYNGYACFYKSIGLYRETKSETYRTSLMFNDPDTRFKRCFVDFDDEDLITTPEPQPNDILKNKDGVDLTGISDSTMNLYYFLHNDIDTFKKVMHRDLLVPIDEIEKDIKLLLRYSKYDFYIELIKYHEKYIKPTIKDFQDLIFEMFGYRDTLTCSGNLIGYISSCLNLKHNAIPLKHINDKDRHKVDLNVYLELFKKQKNSEYDYRLNERTENPTF